MVKVMHYTTISHDDERFPFIKNDERVWWEYEDVKQAANDILELDGLFDYTDVDSRRMRLIGSDYYYDPDHPEDTRREWTYRMGVAGVYYDEMFTIEIED